MNQLQTVYQFGNCCRWVSYMLNWQRESTTCRFNSGCFHRDDSPGWMVGLGLVLYRAAVVFFPNLTSRILMRANNIYCIDSVSDWFPTNKITDSWPDRTVCANWLMFQVCGL